MKTIKYIASTILLSSMAVSAIAASPNGPKPENCPPNQIPVFKQNIGWVCDYPHIQSNTTSPEATSRGGLSKATTTTKPQRAKPDLSIANHYQMTGPTPTIDKFKVYVKNTGSAKSPACNMSMNSSNGGGSISVPEIKAGGGEWIEVTFAKFKDKTAINLYVDSQKKVNESNEKNNAYRFAWKAPRK